MREIVQCLAAVVLVLGVLVACPGLSQEAPEGDPRNAIDRVGVQVLYEDDVPAPYAEAIADTVEAAKMAFDELFPELALGSITVIVHQAPGFFEHTTTDRAGRIFVSLGEKGLGERFRPDAGPVEILCESVAELHNRWRLPGFERYIAHRYLAKAVAERTGADLLPNAWEPQGDPDPTGMLSVVSDPFYAEVHPDYAAVWVLRALDDALGFELLRGMLSETAADEEEPLARLREAAADARVDEAYSAYTKARIPEVGEDGACLVTSFEAEEVLTLTGWSEISPVGVFTMYCSTSYGVSQSDEWAADGELSLKLEAREPHTYMGAWIVDPDWRFGDWTRFSRFEMDLMLEAADPEDIRVFAGDHVSEGHGHIMLLPEQLLEPGEPVHISVDLTPEVLAGEAAWQTRYFDGQVRADRMSAVCIQVPRPTGAFTLYVDNIRLWPRDGG